MSIEQQMCHVYRPSGFVGTMTLEAAVDIAAKDPQIIVESANIPPSQQAVAVIQAAEKRTKLRHRWVQAEDFASRRDVILGGFALLVFFTTAVLFVASWIR